MWCALGCCLPPVTPKWPGLLRTPAQPSPALPCLLSPTTNIQLPQNVFTWMSYSILHFTRPKRYLRFSLSNWLFPESPHQCTWRYHPPRCSSQKLGGPSSGFSSTSHQQTLQVLPTPALSSPFFSISSDITRSKLFSSFSAWT